MTKNTEPPSITEEQTLAYVTLRNIVSETSYLEKDWGKFVIKELLDNAWDWLNDAYPITNNGKDVRKIAVRLWTSSEKDELYKFIHIAVRNSNFNNKKVFNDLEQIFNFKSWHGTKRHQHRMTCGSLGDALKRCLGMGYASWTKDYDPDESLEDKQWDEPLIIRCNGQEFRIFIKVDLGRSIISNEIKQESKPSRDIDNDTEVEVVLPMPSSNIIEELHKYYRPYRIGKLKTTDFSIDIPGVEYQQ